MSVKEVMDVIPSPEKHVLDVMGVFALMGVFADFLPSLVLVLTGIWTSLRIYETDTVQKLLRKKNGKTTSSD